MDEDSGEVFTGILAAYFTANQELLEEDVWGMRVEPLGDGYNILFGF